MKINRTVVVHVLVVTSILLVMLSVIYTLFSWHRNEENVRQLQQTIVFFSKEIAPFFKRADQQTIDFSFLHPLVSNILLASHTHIANVYVVNHLHQVLWSFQPGVVTDAHLQSLSALIQKGRESCYLRVTYYPLTVSLFQESWLRFSVIVICLVQVLYELMRALFASSFELGFWAEAQTDKRWQTGDFSHVIGLPKTISKEGFQQQLIAMRGVSETFGRLSRRYRILLNSEVDTTRREQMTQVFNEATARSRFAAPEERTFLLAWAGRSEGRWLLFLSVLLTGGLFLEVGRADFVFSVMIGFLGWGAGFFAGQRMAHFVSKRTMLLLAHMIFMYSFMLAYVHFGTQEVYEFFPAVCWGAMGLLSYIFMSPLKSDQVVIPPHEEARFPFYSLWLGFTALTPFMNMSIFSFIPQQFFFSKVIYIAICWLFLVFYSCLFAFRHPAWDDRSEQIPVAFDFREVWREYIYVFFVGMSVYHILSSFLMYDAHDVIGMPILVMLVMGVARFVSLRKVMIAIFALACIIFLMKLTALVLIPFSVRFMLFVAMSTVLVMAYQQRSFQDKSVAFRPLNMVLFFVGMLLDSFFHDHVYWVFVVLLVSMLVTVIFSLDRKNVCSHG